MPGLFSELRLKDITLRNRIAISPMTQYSCGTDGITTDWHLVHLGARAAGGAGLVVMEQLAVSPEGRMTPGCAGIWSDEQVPMLRRITDFIRATGAVPGVQLGHSGRKGSISPPWDGYAQLDEGHPDGWEPVGPTADARANAEPSLAFDINVGGTLNLMQAIAGLKRDIWVFYASTSHVYAPSSGPIGESHVVAPRNVYSLTKRLGEETAAFFGGSGPVCIGRIFSIYDPEQTGSYLYPMMAARVANHTSTAPIAVADGGSVRDFSTASAIAASMLRLMTRRAEGIVNIGSGEGRTVVDHLGRLFGPKVTFVAEPSDTTCIVADVGLLERLSA